MVLVVAGGLILLTVVLPILSFVRAQQAQRTAADVARRLAGLEAEMAALRRAPVAPTIPRPAQMPLPAPAPPVGPAVAEPPVTSPVPPSITTPAAVNEPAPRPQRGDLEQQIGSRWLLYAGIAAVVLGMSYFVKFAFDNGWISEPLRVMGGVVIGLGLVAGGMRFWSHGLAPFGQALAGGGVVVLYVSIYAALHFYRLLEPAPAFGLMVVVTAGAAWLADRQRSPPMAALALLGGFATPLLVGGERGVQVVLFTYIAILISGAALLARRHAWPLVSAGSYICTFLLVLAWFFSSYDAAHWLRTELFLTLYVVLFAYLLWALLASPGRQSPQAQLAIAALATAPLVYHLASIVLLNERPAAWLLYLVLVTVAALAVAQRTQTAWLRVLVLLLVGFPAMVWLEGLRYPAWYGPAAATACLLYLLHLAAQWEAAGDCEATRLSVLESIHMQVNGLLLPLSLYLFFEDRFAVWSSWMVGALSGWNAVLAMAARRRAPGMSLQFVALSATLAAAAIVLAVDGPAVAAGWAAEGVLLGWLASRQRSRWLALGSALLIALGSLQLAQALAGPAPLGEIPILNARTLAAAIVIGLLAWLASRLRRDESEEVRGRARDGLIILANLLAVLLLSAEIHTYFDRRALEVLGDARSARAAASLGEQLTLSVTWALYAVTLIAIGIRRRYAPARYFAIVLFAVTVAKVLINDIAGLDRFYRMLSVLVVGILLLVASYLYQRRSSADGDPD